MNIYYEKIESCKIVLCSVILKPEIHRRNGNGVFIQKQMLYLKISGV